MSDINSQEIRAAAAAIRESTALIIGAGAGMGVDSGLPDFRGNEGFWRAYPPMKNLGLSFYDLANPVWFDSDPQRAWGFYGHRLNLYRQTPPHAGFVRLLEWAESRPHGYFVFTSNVDGHFQKSGFDPHRVVECHGSVNYFQCAAPCSSQVWNADVSEIDVDLSTFRAKGRLPTCKVCGLVARPNILMFGDFSWVPGQTEFQYQRYHDWIGATDDQPLVVIEIGAGTAVPTVRYECERRASRSNATLVRINPREGFGRDAISIELGGLDAVNAISQLM